MTRGGRIRWTSAEPAPVWGMHSHEVDAPIIRPGGLSQRPFCESANPPALRVARDELVRAGPWVPPLGVGAFPVRFPPPDEPGDDGPARRGERRRPHGATG
ncbi:hypothetical protein GCM10009610_42240 [Pseudonocardia xinjiangensis]